YPPPMSPKKELLPAAYVENGGPIDPQTWRYYTTGTGLLVGLDALQDALVPVVLHGAAFQVGVGASGKNVKLGASGWITGQVTQQPSTGFVLPQFVNGDGSFDLVDDDRPCVAEAPANPAVGGVDGDHAFIFVNLGKFVFVDMATWTERQDGTGSLVASIQSLLQPTYGFDVTLE